MNQGIRSTSGYLPRVLDAELDDLFVDLPAILIDGPKGVGKTATAERRARTVRRLDDPGQRRLLEADSAILRLDEPPVLVDEWQRVPAMWDTIRRLVDERPDGGRFLLTGSAPTRGLHSGAGRITGLRMRPLTLSERQRHVPSVRFRDLLDGAAAVRGACPLDLVDYVDEILSSGFPAIRRLPERAREVQLDSYVQAIVDRDLPELGHAVRRPEAVLSWLRAYAAAVGTTTAWEKIRDAATPGVGNKPAKTTTIVYTELLTALRILDPIPAWMPTHNHLGRLAAAPKHHLADPALAARLLRRTRTDLLHGNESGLAIPRDGTLLGSLFESLAALSVRTYAQAAGGSVSHFRSEGGLHEIDFIVEGRRGVLALEAKLSSHVDDADVRHLVWLQDRLGERLVDAVVLTTGTDAYRRPDGVAVVPLGLLGP